MHEAIWKRVELRPSFVANLATADPDALYESWRIGDRGPDRANLCILWYVRLMEYLNHVVLPERSKACGREIISLHLVLLGEYESATVRFWSLCCPVSLKFFQGMLKYGDLLYPEITETVWIWRPPWIASRIYAVLRPMMDPNLRAILCFLNEEKEKELPERYL